LVKESLNPLRGLRRGLWVALFGSAFLGFLIMLSKLLSGDSLQLKDLSIQVAALVIFGTLLWVDREKKS